MVREMLYGAQPTHANASDAGGPHLSITKGVWAPVSTPSPPPPSHPQVTPAAPTQAGKPPATSQL